MAPTDKTARGSTCGYHRSEFRQVFSEFNLKFSIPPQNASVSRVSTSNAHSPHPFAIECPGWQRPKGDVGRLVPALPDAWRSLDEQLLCQPKPSGKNTNASGVPHRTVLLARLPRAPPHRAQLQDQKRRSTITVARSTVSAAGDARGEQDTGNTKNELVIETSRHPCAMSCQAAHPSIRYRLGRGTFLLSKNFPQSVLRSSSDNPSRSYLQRSPMCERWLKGSNGVQGPKLSEIRSLT
ncbi:predicted protein [Histoplasma capsulatum G186AR]|uniref:Uncharacterized protein n=1 Tax=Ajellomyces capsulatus (strain G186AR / H82 / ATCC MYA-2454 / RMSCC 2432) TaxID=447093 RepID=C0NRE0_AJECG|nr:uncharacterized protein HCBG_05570 [Histoplasma capsulatum G186AR]EEH06254.1 predicted protein [Histoplasma capsulatum G186AR]